jgi:hypothetical protein
MNRQLCDGVDAVSNFVSGGVIASQAVLWTEERDQSNRLLAAKMSTVLRNCRSTPVGLVIKPTFLPFSAAKSVATRRSRPVCSGAAMTAGAKNSAKYA